MEKIIDLVLLYMVNVVEGKGISIESVEFNFGHEDTDRVKFMWSMLHIMDELPLERLAPTGRFEAILQ